jgi:hypothetical protein
MAPGLFAYFQKTFSLPLGSLGPFLYGKANIEK